MKASKMIRLTVLTAAPAYMTRTAARTVRADCGTPGRSRIRRPLLIRSAARARPGRRGPGPPLAARGAAHQPREDLLPVLSPERPRIPGQQPPVPSLEARLIGH